MACRAYLNGDESSPSGTDTIVPFDTVSFDTHNGFDTTSAVESGRGEYTVPVTGIYKVSATVAISEVTAGTSGSVRVRSNTTTKQYVFEEADSVGSGRLHVQIDDLLQLTKGDKIDVVVVADASYTIQGTGGYTIFSAYKIK